MAWVEVHHARFPRWMRSGVSDDRSERRVCGPASLLPEPRCALLDLVPSTMRFKLEIREVRRNWNIAQVKRPIQRGTSRSVKGAAAPRDWLRAGQRTGMLKGDPMPMTGLIDRISASR